MNTLKKQKSLKVVKNMKIFNLLRSEFIKNYTLKRFIIITLILIVSSLFLVNINNQEKDYNTVKHSIDSFSNLLENKINQENKTFTTYYSIEYDKAYIKYMSKLIDKNIKYNKDFRIELINNDLIPLIMKNYLITKMEQNSNDEYIISSCISNDISDESSNTPKKVINDLCNNYTKEERKALSDLNNKKIKELENLLNLDSYYLYLEYQIKEGKIKEDEFTKILISNKEKRSDSPQVLNYLQYKRIEETINMNIMSKNEYIKSGEKISEYKIYENYAKTLKNKAISNKKILLYSTKNNIKHDLNYSYFENIEDAILYQNTKSKVNEVFHLSVIISLIICISSGKIVSGEHSKKTIKNIITAPVKRWKILLSKFIYMILDAYLIWFLGLLIITIIAGLKYGFSDLLTPKLIYHETSVIEVNYFLYLIKDIFIASIPLIAFISVIFFLSVVSLNTSLTVGITSGLATLSICLWLMSVTGNITSIIYTPFWYLDLGFILNNSTRYIESLRNVSYSIPLGILVSIVWTIILYTISNIVYIKRDIKN